MQQLKKKSSPFLWKKIQIYQKSNKQQDLQQNNQTQITGDKLSNYYLKKIYPEKSTDYQQSTQEKQFQIYQKSQIHSQLDKYTYSHLITQYLNQISPLIIDDPKKYKILKTILQQLLKTCTQQKKYLLQQKQQYKNNQFKLQQFIKYLYHKLILLQQNIQDIKYHFIQFQSWLLYHKSKFIQEYFQEFYRLFYQKFHHFFNKSIQNQSIIKLLTNKNQLLIKQNKQYYQNIKKLQYKINLLTNQNLQLQQNIFYLNQKIYQWDLQIINKFQQYNNNLKQNIPPLNFITIKQSLQQNQNLYHQSSSIKQKDQHFDQNINNLNQKIQRFQTNSEKIITNLKKINPPTTNQPITKIPYKLKYSQRTQNNKFLSFDQQSLLNYKPHQNQFENFDQSPQQNTTKNIIQNYPILFSVRNKHPQQININKIKRHSLNNQKLKPYFLAPYINTINNNIHLKNKFQSLTPKPKIISHPKHSTQYQSNQQLQTNYIKQNKINNKYHYHYLINKIINKSSNPQSNIIHQLQHKINQLRYQIKKQINSTTHL